ncbi:Ty3/gypsy retrotransposon protein, partial [Trifolium medium]|nr:Ty3/gypsy retrotransposon protein [Trifolium medium]
MGDRVDALETRMDTVDTTLAELVRQMQTHATQMQQQSHVLAKLSEQMSQIGQKEVSNEGDTSVNNSLQGESRLAGKKVKLPLFDGEDPVAWITRAEIYFDVQNTTDDMRVKLARLSMEGSTIHWFNLLMETEDELSWEKLKRALIARYGGRRLENPFEELSTLQQKGTVEEFVESFELLSSQVGRLPEEQYLGYFMSGLKPQIRRRVRTLNPRNRMEMMRIAKDVEGELKEDDDDSDCRIGKKGSYERLGQKDWAGSMRNRSGSQSRDFTRYTNASGPNANSKTGSTVSNANSNSMNSTARKSEGNQRSGAPERWKGFRSFQSSEMEERRIKGLCFKCGGKYHPTLHKCPEKSLRVLILGDGETLNEEGEIVSLEEEDADSDEELVECKLMGVLGSMGESHTMKVEGKIQNVDVFVLIDSGASHNFISPKVTTALGLAITPTAARNIKLGDGHKVLTKGMCEGVKMKVGELEVVVDAFVLELGGMDMVLGVSWLSTLGKVVMDWKAMTMQFLSKNQEVKLQGL